MRLFDKFERTLLAALACCFALGCADDPPLEPPGPPDPDFLGTFALNPVRLSIREPTVTDGGKSLRLSVASVSFDPVTGRVSAYVVIRNQGANAIVGPEGVALFGFSNGARIVGGGNPCERVDIAQPDVPADACLLDYRGAYGTGGMLSSGDASGSRLWILADSAHVGFTFHARLVDRGLATAGEISGVVYDDRDDDGVRDDDESGIANSYLTITYPDSLHYGRTNDSGHFTFQVGAPGEYLVQRSVDGRCCPTTAGARPIEILVGPSGLAGYGRADFGCNSEVMGYPSVAFLDVRTLGRPEIPPCHAAEPCTVAAGESFDVRFTGASACGGITGFQWQTIWPGDIWPEPLQPFGVDSLFLDAGTDTTAVSSSGDTLWSLTAEIVRVRRIVTANRYQGNLQFRARVRDSYGRPSPFSNGNRRIALNYDPDTDMLRIPACDCPNPPPDCATRGLVPAGWITGIDAVTFADSSQWILFCQGDTLPQRAHVRFYARGADDPRDAPLTPPTLQPVGFSYRFEWRIYEVESRTQPPSSEYDPRAYTLPPPLGTSWQGGGIGWGHGYNGICPFDYTFYASAVDEHEKRDGTPDSLRFYVSGTPSLGPVDVPNVLVLMPRCPAGFESFCDPEPTFGADTLAVRGTFVQGSSAFPLALGSTRFNLPIRASGHDHPRDRSAHYSSTNIGRIKSWRFTFDCTSGCEDLLLPSEGLWIQDVQRSDPPGVQQFDELLTVTIPNDTLCLASPCGSNFRLVFRDMGFGNYVFTLQGRDTSPFETGREPSDLGPMPFIFTRQIGELGRKTDVVTRDVVLRQLRDVRPGGTSPTSPFVHRAIRLEQR